jgi:hypothetical protein
MLPGSLPGGMMSEFAEYCKPMSDALATSPKPLRTQSQELRDERRGDKQHQRLEPGQIPEEAKENEAI